MIQLRSILTPADNTGAKRLMVIQVKGGWKRKAGHLGDVAMVVIKKAIPNGMVKAGEKSAAVIVRTKKAHRRADGSYVRFDDNAAVLIGPEGEPKGTRIFGPVAREVKDRGFTKVVSMAKEII